MFVCLSFALPSAFRCSEHSGTKPKSISVFVQFFNRTSAKQSSLCRKAYQHDNGGAGKAQPEHCPNGCTEPLQSVQF